MLPARIPQFCCIRCRLPQSICNRHEQLIQLVSGIDKKHLGKSSEHLLHLGILVEDATKLVFIIYNHINNEAGSLTELSDNAGEIAVDEVLILQSPCYIEHEHTQINEVKKQHELSTSQDNWFSNILMIMNTYMIMIDQILIIGQEMLLLLRSFCRT